MRRQVTVTVLVALVIVVGLGQVMAKPVKVLDSCPGTTISGYMLSLVRLEAGTRVILTDFIAYNEIGEVDQCYQILPPPGNF
jgi:hypothetical protein